MVDIRPKDLPPAILPLRTGDAVIIDQGADGVRQANPISFTDSVAPVATQSEAQTGTDNTKRMTPLRTKQSIASEIGVSIASNSQGDKADSAVQSVNGKAGNAVAIDKNDVGLGNVDNTSDASKPISTATQSALNLKADSSVTISAGTGLDGGGSLAANRTLALSSASIASLAKADSSVQTVNGIAPTAGNVSVSAEEIRLQDSRSSAIAESFANNVQFVETAGYSSVGDGGAALYKRVAIEPSHSGKFQSADGAWWEISCSFVNPKQFGAVGDGVSDDTVSFNAWKEYLVGLKKPGEVTEGLYKVSNSFDFGGIDVEFIQGASLISLDGSPWSGGMDGVFVGGNASSPYRKGFAYTYASLLPVDVSNSPIVVVLTGQSNAPGTTNATSGDFVSDSDIGVWNAPTNSFIDADFATQSYASNKSFPTTTYNFFGNGVNNLGSWFCKRLREETGRKVYLIQCGEGSANISLWINTDGSERLWIANKHDIETALATVGLTKVDFFLWQQGETNAADPNYPNLVNALITRLKTQTWFTDETVFVAGEPAPQWDSVYAKDLKKYVNMLYNLGNPNYRVARSDGLESTGVAGDSVHFSGLSLQKLGYERYYNALLPSASRTIAPDFTLQVDVQGSNPNQFFGEVDFTKRHYRGQVGGDSYQIVQNAEDFVSYGAQMPSGMKATGSMRVRGQRMVVGSAGNGHSGKTEVQAAAHALRFRPDGVCDNGLNVWIRETTGSGKVGNSPQDYDTYLAGDTVLVQKHTAGRTTQATANGDVYLGAFAEVLTTIPAPGGFGEVPLTQRTYPLDAMLAISGYTGNGWTSAYSGHDAAATSGAFYGITIGGGQGGIWTGQYRSRFDRGIYITDCIYDGLVIDGGHPLKDAGFNAIRTGANSGRVVLGVDAVAITNARVVVGTSGVASDNGIHIIGSTHATSNKATINFDDKYVVGADVGGTGSTQFSVFDRIHGLEVFGIDADGDFFVNGLPTSASGNKVWRDTNGFLKVG